MWNKGCMLCSLTVLGLRIPFSTAARVEQKATNLFTCVISFDTLCDSFRVNHYVIITPDGWYRLTSYNKHATAAYCLQIKSKIQSTEIWTKYSEWPLASPSVKYGGRSWLDCWLSLVYLHMRKWTVKKRDWQLLDSFQTILHSLSTLLLFYEEHSWVETMREI